MNSISKLHEDLQAISSPDHDINTRIYLVIH